MLNWVSEIRDPVHGYIYMTEVERSIIDTPPVQRLRRIKQLAGAYLTYAGGEHTRFCHALGVMYISGLLSEHLVQKGHVTSDVIEKIRIAGLLHDVGHGPFSHIYEELLEKHRHVTHEDLTEWLVKKSEIKDVLSSNGFSAKEMSSLAIGSARNMKKAFINQIIAGQFSADILDYLLRDSYFTGVEYGKVDIKRLINSVDVVNDILAMDMAAFYALESLLIARYEMFKAVYFHRTVRAAGIMIVRAMDYANDFCHLTDFKTPNEYLALDDSSAMQRLLSLKGEGDKRLRIAYDYAQRVNNRNLMKCTYEVMFHHKDQFFINLLSRDEVREKIVEDISSESGVESDYIIVDVPTVPSVPYNPMQTFDNDTPVFQRNPNGTKELRRLSEFSQLIDSLSGYVDVVRVYTLSQHREKVQIASEKIFGKRPSSIRVSF
jgi:uncharacterized protein